MRQRRRYSIGLNARCAESIAKKEQRWKEEPIEVLVRQAHDLYRSFSYSFKQGVPADPGLEKRFAEHCALIGILSERLSSGERIIERIFRDNDKTPAEVIDYCCSRFAHFALEYKKAPEEHPSKLYYPKRYSPFQAVPLVRCFANSVAQQIGRVYQYYEQDTLREEGIIAGAVEFLIEPFIENYLRMIYMPVRERRSFVPLYKENEEKILIHSNFFDPAVRNMDDAQTWEGFFEHPKSKIVITLGKKENFLEFI